jgi:hypothetical protein
MLYLAIERFIFERRCTVIDCSVLSGSWYNFLLDLPIRVRIFGTYKDAVDLVPNCGFPGTNENRLTEMPIFKDVYDRGYG